MNSDSSRGPRETAVAQLEAFGLSVYAARTFVALVRLGVGTAKDVSEIADVPRTRVYDAAAELHERGLIDVNNTNPKKFWPISTETTRRKFEQEFQHRAERLTTALDALGPAERHEEQRGVWTVTGSRSVADRVVEFLDSADDEIVYMTVETLLTDDVIGALRTAAKRGVSIKLAGISPAVRDEILSEIPTAETFESLWIWSDTPAARLMMVDGEKTLVSVLANGEDGSPDERSETAIWGSGEYNSLVVVLRGIFTWRLNAVREE